jgi:hypothetical protein
VLLNVAVLIGAVYGITEGVKNALPKLPGWGTNLVAAGVSVATVFCLAYSGLDTADTIAGKHLAQLNAWGVLLLGLVVGFGGATTLDNIFGAINNIGQNQPAAVQAPAITPEIAHLAAPPPEEGTPPIPELA